MQAIEDCQASQSPGPVALQATRAAFDSFSEVETPCDGPALHYSILLISQLLACLCSPSPAWALLSLASPLPPGGPPGCLQSGCWRTPEGFFNHQAMELEVGNGCRSQGIQRDRPLPDMEYGKERQGRRKEGARSSSSSIAVCP